MTHRFRVRVYHEDIDQAGIVYYANHLKFIERARTEWARELGVGQTELSARDGIVIAVRRLEADYLIPARFDDELSVVTSVRAVSGARIILQQDILRDGTLLFSAAVTLVALTRAGRPVRLPEGLALDPH